ncbi:hypothetical protein AVEN_107446-1 [Araneus ventricosus]|uniref:Uncharacterized protein n=1 Tax=Araneus ventricosus TaxID=182803 RepID=A0A4Y2FIA9_ARAVE|nr:hypothetical protein AVEN_107446-1 [Araneus ventricosus]
MSNTETLQWAADTDDSLARNEILTGDEIIRTVTAEDDDDDITPVNPVKISHSEAVATLNTSLQWSEEQNFEAHEIMLLRQIKGNNRSCKKNLKIGIAVQRLLGRKVGLRVEYAGVIAEELLHNTFSI